MLCIPKSVKKDFSFNGGKVGLLAVSLLAVLNAQAEEIYLPAGLSEPLKQGNQAKREISEAEYKALDAMIDSVGGELDATPLSTSGANDQPDPYEQAKRLRELSADMRTASLVRQESDETDLRKVTSIRHTEGGINPYPDYGLVTKKSAPEAPQAEEAPLKSRAREIYDPKPVITAHPSDPITITVAVGQSNRIAFNFESLNINTANLDAPMMINGGFLYITPKSENDPIALMVGEQGLPGSAINLLLLPADVPPVMADVTVLLSNELKQKRTSMIAEKKEAERLALEELEQVNKALERGETDIQKGTDPYQERITRLLVEVAKEDIPAGFSLRSYNEVSKYDRYPCDNSKMLMKHETMMQLESSREIIDIVKVTNDINGLRSVEEDSCISPGVMAAAVYNKSMLLPGESTEIYILRDKEHSKKRERLNARKRPSLR